jgi:4-hydroxy-tetrahydrodipicolinate synthase
MKYSGVLTALVTPFKKGRVDYNSLKRLVRQQMDGGVSGFVVNGTTAESPTLEDQEVVKIFEVVREESDAALPLVLGVGSNSTKKTLQNLAVARKLKAEAALVVVPYYNKPPQRGILEHFRTLAKATKLPIIAYNVPGRTVIGMTSETIVAVAKLKGVVGIKEASGQLNTLEQIKKMVPKSFLLSSGDDGSAIDFVLAGGHGVISVISHLIPREFSDLVSRARNQDSGVSKEYATYSELNRLLGVEANPIPVKMGLYKMGVINSPEMRLPLVTLSKENEISLEAELRRLSLL